MKKAFFTLILCSVCLECPLVFMIVLRYTRLLRPTEALYCFKNPDLHTERTADGWTVEKDRIKMQEGYCYKISEAMNNISSKMTAERYDKDANPEYYSSNLTMFNCKIDKSQKSKAKFYYNGSGAFLGLSQNILWKIEFINGNDVQYDDEERVISFQKSGHFFVNIQMTIRIENRNCSINFEEIIRLQVVRVTAEQDKELVILENAKSVCQVPDKSAENSLSIGAAFFFAKDEKIYAKMSQKHLLVPGIRRNILSIHEI